MPHNEPSQAQYKVSDFLNWHRTGLLVLNPRFQRRPVWKKGAKSFLVDTIIRRLPMPIILLRDLPADVKTLQSSREVVDGQQRLRTVISYIAPESLTDFDKTTDSFTLSHAHHSTAIAGKPFSKLPSSVRRAILDYRFSVHSFSSDTDDREILQIFARLNSTGTKLNPQELRNAEYFGYFKTVAYELAMEQLDRWTDKWSVFTSTHIARMQEVETTGHLMILILKGVTSNTTTVLDRVYEDYDERFSARNEVQRRFRATMDIIDDKFSAAHIQLFTKRVMFYALFAALYDAAFGLRAPMQHRKARSVSKQTVARLVKAAQRIHSESATQSVLDAATGRRLDAENLKRIVKYLQKVS